MSERERKCVCVCVFFCLCYDAFWVIFSSSIKVHRLGLSGIWGVIHARPLNPIFGHLGRESLLYQLLICGISIFLFWWFTQLISKMFYNFTLCENSIYIMKVMILPFSILLKITFKELLSLILILDFENEFIYFIY